jgi:AcrR family transcriptional regulator
MKKTPSQGRSRQMVDALVEATARTIAERGWQGTTTNHIAVRAGVSVGSLYQYFESREDLLAALMERERNRLLRRLDEAIPGVIGVGPRTGIRALLEIAFEEADRDKALFTALSSDWHTFGASEFADELQAYMLDALRLFLAKLYDVYQPMDAPTVSFMLTNGAVMIISRFFTTKPLGVTQDKLLDEMTDLYAGYFESKLRAPTTSAQA